MLKKGITCIIAHLVHPNHVDIRKQGDLICSVKKKI